MEIEAKFAIPDLDSFQRLQAIADLAGFALSADQVKHVRDTYLDTAGQNLLAGGHACRLRETGQDVLLTLKRMKKASGAVHRREELEVLLPDVRRPAQGVHIPYLDWPSSAVCDRLFQLVGEASLLPLFTLEQTRTARLMSRDERAVAELSLDDVHLIVGGREQAYLELEVELQPHGTEDDLAAIVTCLQDEWDLEAEPRSKFERGMAFLAEIRSEHDLLPRHERSVLELIAPRDDLHGRRAKALLALDEGATQEEAGKRAGMSARRVRHWLAGLRQKRLGIFPPRILAEVTPVATYSEPETLPEPAPVPEAEEPPEPWTLESLFNTYGVDPTHAHSVAGRALVLFDQLQPFHGLSPERRNLLKTAALVHNVGLETDPDRHHIAGRDILLVHPPIGLDGHERLMVATITFLHRKRITRNKLNGLAQTLFAAMPDSLQTETLALAALLRMADGLDYSQTGSSKLERGRVREGLIEFVVAGSKAAADAERAQQKSDLWHQLFDIDVEFRPHGASPTEDTLPRMAKTE